MATRLTWHADAPLVYLYSGTPLERPGMSHLSCEISPFPCTILYKSCLFYPSWQDTSFKRPPFWVAFIEGFHCIHAYGLEFWTVYALTSVILVFLLRRNMVVPGNSDASTWKWNLTHQIKILLMVILSLQVRSWLCEKQCFPFYVITGVKDIICIENRFLF